MSLVFPARLFWYLAAAAAVGLPLSIATAVDRVLGEYSGLRKA